MEKLLRIEEKLKNIQSEIDSLKLNYNYNNGFDNKTDLRQFINDNKGILEESNNLKKEIKQLKWDLMTPEEQAKRLELERKIIAKKRKNRYYTNQNYLDTHIVCLYE